MGKGRNRYKKTLCEVHMYMKGTILKTDADFYNSILFQTQVEVYQQGEILDYGGIIKEFSSDTVKIDDFYYLRATCVFCVR